MNNFSLMEKFSMLMKLISSSYLFLICMIIGVLILTILIICTIFNKKVNKWVFIIVSTIVGILLLINYGDIIIKVLDIILDGIFMALYFPNLPVYISVILISNIVFIASIFNKRQTKVQKITNTINAIFLNFLLILIIEVVRKNNINIYEEITLYTNSNLLVLLELSMGIFVSWILISLFISAHKKLKKYDKNEYPEMPEIIFD